jgi:hypothetical protein
MKKVLKDGTLGITEADVFPEELKGSWCVPATETGSQETDLEEFYFE